MKLAFLDIPAIGLLLYFLFSSLVSIDRWASFAGSFGVWRDGFFVFFLLVVWYFFGARFVKLDLLWRFGFVVPILSMVFLGFGAQSFVVTFLGLSALLFFHVARKLKGNERPLWRGSEILLIAILFVVLLLLGAFPLASVFTFQDSGFDPVSSWKLAFSTLFDTPKNFLFGTGPGTFSLDALRYSSAPSSDRAVGLNAPTVFAEILATLGVTGSVLYLFLFGFAFFRFALLSTNRTQGFLAAFVVALFGAYVLGPATFLLGFLFWTVAGLAREKTLVIPKFAKPLIRLGTLVVLGFVLFMGVRVLGAEVIYQKAKGEPNSVTRISLLETTIRINPYETTYKIELAKLYIEVAKKGVQQAPSSLDAVQAIENALLHLQKAVETGPKRPEAWEALGVLYKEIQGAPGAKEWGVRSFETALTLSPNNPRLYTELGMLYTGKEELGIAEKYFKKALALSPAEPAILFQLGRIYYNEGRLKDAESAFTQVLLLSPNDSNTHYTLGLLYEKQGKKKEAIQEFQKVLALNPNDSNVILKLNQLITQ